MIKILDIRILYSLLNFCRIILNLNQINETWKINFYRGVGGVIVFLMICSSIYEYGTLSDEKEQDFSSTSNNNERNGVYIDRNLPQDHRISMTRHADKEMFEKISKDVPKDMHTVQVKKEAGWYFLKYINIVFYRKTSL